MSCKFHKPWGAQLVYETRHDMEDRVQFGIADRWNTKRAVSRQTH